MELRRCAALLPEERGSGAERRDDDRYAQAHNCAGPLGFSVRSPVLPGAREFVAAAEAAGIPRGDYNGRDRYGGCRVAGYL